MLLPKPHYDTNGERRHRTVARWSDYLDLFSQLPEVSRHKRNLTGFETLRLCLFLAIVFVARLSPFVIAILAFRVACRISPLRPRNLNYFKVHMRYKPPMGVCLWC